GYRCYYQNRKVGGAQNSRHLHGDAVDIRIWRYLERMTFEELAQLALEAGFTYVAMEDDHLHADVRPLLPGQKPKIDDLRGKGVYERWSSASNKDGFRCCSPLLGLSR